VNKKKLRSRPWWVSRGVYGVLRHQVVTLWKTTWSGVPCKVVRFNSTGAVGRELLDLCERFAEMVLEKSATRNVVGGGSTTLNDQDFEVLYPTLHLYMTQVVWPDGTVRIPSTISVFVDGGVVKVVLKDRDQGLCLWAAAPTMGDLLGVLDALLADPKAEWRVDRASPGQKASRVKK